MKTSCATISEFDSQPFRLARIQRAQANCIIEVKGTTGPLGSVLLTKNEVELARTDPRRAVLAVVYDIELDSKRLDCPPEGNLGRLYSLPWSTLT